MKNRKKRNRKGTGVIKVFLVICSVFVVMGVTFAFIQYLRGNVDFLQEHLVPLVSTKVGTEMKKDQYGNVNILLLGYGGEQHDGGYLTDSIIIASRNPEIGSINMFSIPRDLRVKYPNGGAGRINGAFYTVYRKENRDFNRAGIEILDFYQKLTNIEIPYYAMIDFASFEGVVDALGGVDVNIPETIHDTSYPGPNRSYVTFHLDAGIQHLDGATALKYARSRHSTSDFSRSRRQQLLLMGIKDKMLGSGVSVEIIKKLYEQYQSYVHTNIELPEMLWTIAYLKKITSFKSYGLTTECGYSAPNRMVAACFLYSPARDLFGGAAVMLPDGATANKIDMYKTIQNFFSFIISNPDFANEHIAVGIQNGVGANKKVPMAKNLAVKMKRYGIQIGNLENTGDVAESYIWIYGEQPYTGTITAIQKMLPIQKIVREVPPVQTGDIVLSGEVLNEYTGDNIILVLGKDYREGNSFFSGLSQQKFSYDL